MKISKLIALLGLLAMSAALIYGFGWGDFFVDGGLIVNNPWGIVSLVDLYTGFALFGAWIYYREANKLIALVWIAVLMVLGFWLASLYVLIELYRSKGSYQKFFMGVNKKSA
jgi:hypothetical protein